MHNLWHTIGLLSPARCAIAADGAAGTAAGTAPGGPRQQPVPSVYTSRVSDPSNRSADQAKPLPAAGQASSRGTTDATRAGLPARLVHAGGLVSAVGVVLGVAVAAHAGPVSLHGAAFSMALGVAAAVTVAGLGTAISGLLRGAAVAERRAATGEQERLQDLLAGWSPPAPSADPRTPPDPPHGAGRDRRDGST